MPVPLGQDEYRDFQLLEQFMRIVSWMVVIASISTLSWMGLSPILSSMSLPDMEAEHAVGTTIANTVRAGVEVAQSELDERECEANRDGAAGRDAHRDPAHESGRARKSAKPVCGE